MKLIKNILITGSSRGLGKNMAIMAAKRGATVAITYKSDKVNAEKLFLELKEISKKNHLIQQVACDDLQGNMNFAKRIKEEWGKIDILINNAGMSEFLPLALLEEDDWDKLINTNLKGVYATTKAILPMMVKEKRGHILNISSLAGVKILAAPIHYCASKGGVKSFTEALCKEVGRYNIQVNCLAPGILEGGVADGIPENKVNDFIEQLSLKRTGSFDEVSECALFLVSDLNTYMSGETVVIEGGLS